MDLEAMRQQAEAIWPLGWEIDEDEAQLFANTRAIDLRLDFSDAPPSISCYDGEQPLIDGESFADLETALREAYAAWQRHSGSVPPLTTMPDDATTKARPA